VDGLRCIERARRARRGCWDEAPPVLPTDPDRIGGSFAGFRFPPEVILLAVRWYLRYGLSTGTSRSC